MTEEKTNPTNGDTQAPEADEAFAWTGDEADVAESTPSGREWLTQLQSMIENVTEQAGPVLRQISAKAAELAAVAGEKAGPVAARAAEMTAEAGTRIAERSRDLAAELRRDQAAREASAATTAEAPSKDAPEA